MMGDEAASQGGNSTGNVNGFGHGVGNGAATGSVTGIRTGVGAGGGGSIGGAKNARMPLQRDFDRVNGPVERGPAAHSKSAKPKSRAAPGSGSAALDRRLTSTDGEDNFDDSVENEVGRFGKLSEEERKRRRAESNRLSAERSRERRKNYMKGLELGVKNLQAENVELKKAVLLYQQQIKMMTELVRSTGSQEQIRAVSALDAKVREHFK